MPMQPYTVRAAAPTTADDTTRGFAAGEWWIDTSVSPRKAYLCRDATAGAAEWWDVGVGPQGEQGEQGPAGAPAQNAIYGGVYRIQAAGAAISAEGIVTTVAGTATVANTDTVRRTRLTATSSTAGVYATAANIARMGHNARMWFRLAVGVTASKRTWITFTNAGVGSGDTPTSATIGLRALADGNWCVVSFDGTTLSTPVDTGVACNVTDEWWGYVRLSSAGVHCKIAPVSTDLDDVSEFSVTTNLPSASTNLGPYVVQVGSGSQIIIVAIEGDGVFG